MSKLAKFFLFGIPIALLVFTFLLYFTIKTKSTSLNTYTPFKEWIGKTVLLKRETFLFQEADPMNTEYPYLLLDTLEDRSDIKEVALITIGTKLTIEKAIMYTNGVSGSSFPVLFGSLDDGSKIYPIAYRWGDESLSRRFDKIEARWKFELAPWQDIPDTTFYSLPEAKWW